MTASSPPTQDRDEHHSADSATSRPRVSNMPAVVIAALVLSIVLPPIGLVLAVAALVDIRRQRAAGQPTPGSAPAWAAAVIGAVLTLSAMVLAIVAALIFKAEIEAIDRAGSGEVMATPLPAVSVTAGQPLPAGTTLPGGATAVPLPQNPIPLQVVQTYLSTVRSGAARLAGVADQDLLEAGERYCLTQYSGARDAEVINGTGKLYNDVEVQAIAKAADAALCRR